MRRHADPGSSRRPLSSPTLAATLAATLAMMVSACGGEPTRADLVIENVTVIDARNGVRPGRTVAVRDDEIVSVEESGAPSDAVRVIDGSGRYLIPGLWDMHVHLTYDEALTSAMPALFLRWGVTNVRDTGGLLDELLPVVETMRAEGAAAPRVFFAGPLLDGERVVYDGQGRPEIGMSNSTVEDARANVAALAEAGADFIKIYELVSPQVFDALVTAAGEHGLPVAAHVPLSMRARSVAPRVRSMEHVRNVELDCAAEPERLLQTRREELAGGGAEAGADLRARLHALQRLPAIAAYDADECDQVLSTMGSTIQVPTLRLNSFALRPPFARDDWYQALAAAPPAIAESWRAAGEAWRDAPVEQDTTFAAWSLRLVGWMDERGVPVGAGTDTPINYALPGYALHSELEMLVRAGLTPLEALGAATLRAAEFFDLESEMGAVEPGMRADLVLLAADPLDDISNTRRIEAVVFQGRLLDSSVEAPPR
ncbi:MAG TPA: amidohydrolase family protein [Longimicrobiales bacterium]|nr:amidohydrolase family protein [Longimicrobiales bacterium]